MAKDRFLIAPIKNGLVNNVPSWLIPEDAFELLENAYIDEGKVVKRFGGRYTAVATTPHLSKLRIGLLGGAGVGTTNGAGAAAGTVPVDAYGIGGMFTIGAEVYTVHVLGIPGVMLRYGGAATVFTFDTTTGDYVFAGAAVGTQIYFYPALPVMGLFNYETGALHNRPAIAADTRLIYQFSGTTWDAIGPIAGGVYVPLTGDNDDFFNATNWMGTQFYNTYMFFSNYVAADGMWQWDGAAWTTFIPQFRVNANAALSVVNTARIILPFKDRLILLNTIETDAAGNPHTYQNRCRYSRNGTPDTTHPSIAWLEKDEVGYVGAGWIEAPTEEEIIAAEFIKDRLIVFFERSTWELAYTGNQTRPFVWQKINTELGSESPRSAVPFDKVIITVGTTGIHACSGSNVERIDEEIKDEVFNISNQNSGPFRVAGVRDYTKELVYWTFPSIENGKFAEIYPNKVLVFNYKEGTWALNDDSITAWGYFEQQVAPTWGTSFGIWGANTNTWVSGIVNPQPIQIIAGNQQGYVFLVDTGLARNAGVMQIANVAFAAPVVELTVVNHNIKNGDFVKIENCQGSVEINDLVAEAIVVDVDTIELNANNIAAITAYTGLGTVALVSRINILTKQFNPYVKEGMNVDLDRVDFAVQRTGLDSNNNAGPILDAGQISVGFASSTTSIDLAHDANVTGTSVIDGQLKLDTYAYDNFYPLEAAQRLLWHPVYFQASGEFIQIGLFYSDNIISSESLDNAGLPADIVEKDITIEGIMLYMSPKGRLQ